MLSVEGTWNECCKRLPEKLRPMSVQITRRLGLTLGPDESWTDFVRLEPNRDLPLFAVDAAHRDGLADAVVARYCEAHHCAGFHGLLIDRLADRQAEAPGALAEMLPHTLAWWRAALTSATGDAGVAQAAIDASLRAWRFGVAVERRGLASSSVTPGRYAQIVTTKLRWIGVGTHVMLRSLVGSDRARAFRKVHERFLLGLQCLDDAVDGDEDRETFGCDYASALGVPRGALVLAAWAFTQQAAARARRDRFMRFADWLDARAAHLERYPIEDDRARSAFGAAVLVGSIG